MGYCPTLQTMKIAVITDIHEDFRNLEKAFDSIKMQGCDLVVCLGDITGYSPLFYSHAPDANACIDMLKYHSAMVTAGNHDLFSSQRLPSYHLEKNMPANWYQLPVAERLKITRKKIWLYQEEVQPVLSKENFTFLEGLKEWEVVDTGKGLLLFSHFFQPDLAGVGRWFPFNSLEISDHFRFMRAQKCKFAFAGHSHPPGAVTVNRLFWSHTYKDVITIRGHHKAVICPAIVGERFPGSYITFDTEKNLLSTILID